MSCFTVVPVRVVLLFLRLIKLPLAGFKFSRPISGVLCGAVGVAHLFLLWNSEGLFILFLPGVLSVRSLSLQK